MQIKDTTKVQLTAGINLEIYLLEVISQFKDFYLICNATLAKDKYNFYSLHFILI